MAATESSEEEDYELRDVKAEISGLRTAETELLEIVRPASEELEKITRRKQKCIDRLHHLKAEKHDREKDQRYAELQYELIRVKCENETLKRTNSTMNKLKQSLDHAVKNSRLQTRTIAELNEKISVMQLLRVADIAVVCESAGNSNDFTELQQQLHNTNELLGTTKEELNKTRQCLSDVQERLSVAEQVTAATRQRELQESVNSEQLQLELTSKHQHAGLNPSFKSV